MIVGYRIVVNTTPTLLNTVADTGGGGAGQTFNVRNVGSQSIYVGASNVATTTGYEVPAGTNLSINLDGGEVLYGIAAGATTVHVLQQSN